MSDESLQALHEAFTEVCIEVVKTAKSKPEEIGASALSVVRQFLKDNHIEAKVVPGSPLDELTKDYPFENDAQTSSH